MSARAKGQTFGGGRKLAIFVNVVVMVVLAVAATGIVTYLTGFTQLQRRFDLTADRTYTLSPETIALLQELDTDLEIITIADPVTYHWDTDQVRPTAMQYVVDLLQEYKIRSGGRLVVENLDGHRDDARVRDLFREYGFRTYNIAIVRSGDQKRILTLDADLAEIDPGGFRPVFQKTRLVSLKVEEALSSAVYEVTQGEKPKVYVITGHEELSIAKGGMAEASLVGQTLSQDNMEVAQLSLFAERRIPDDADVVLLLGPITPFVEEERAAIDAYLRRGGRMLIAIDPMGDESLDELYRELGIEIERNIICHIQGNVLQGGSAADLWIGGGAPGAYGDHEITRELLSKGDTMVVARNAGLSPTEAGLPYFTSLLLSHPRAFGDVPRDDKRPGNYLLDPRSETEGQRTLAAALELGEPYEDARVVFVGGVPWVTNKALTEVPGNDRFLRRAVAWLTGQKKRMTLPPRRPPVNAADLRPEEYDRIFVYTVIVLPLAAILLALLVWFARRR